MPLDAQKSLLRTKVRDLRRAAWRDGGAASAVRLKDNFTAAMAAMDFPPPGAAVAGYWAAGGEMDLGPLLAHLDGAGYACALPVVAARRAPLVFRRWRPEMELIEGPLGIGQPGPEAAELRPRVVLCPLLAFDGEGFRLGQGGGYYDRALGALRAAGPVAAVGIAFAVQQVEAVPRDRRDQRLDWAVTEQGAIRFGIQDNGLKQDLSPRP